MIKCKNRYCKFHDEYNKCSLKKAYIGEDARCENFEKGFLHYFYYFMHEMNGNMILLFNISDDVRYSIYYLMRCLPIVYSVDVNRGFIVLRDKDKPDKILSVEDILDMIGSDRFDKDELHNCIYDFQEHGLPTIDKEDENKETVEHDYGWVSPTGEFIETPWGNHEKAAEKIIDSKGFGDEYNEWLDEQPNNTMGINFRDFLIKVKGYALIHSPSNIGYNVTYNKKLTKKQRDFLYGYFSDMGMTLLAEAYLDE